MLFLTDAFLSNYADHNNLYSIGKDGDIRKNLLQKDFTTVTKRFFKNYMPKMYIYIYIYIYI